jgi:hypothetical protein
MHTPSRTLIFIAHSLAVCSLLLPTLHTQGAGQQQGSQAGLIQQLKAQCSGMAAVLPFASSTVIKASSSSQAEIYYGLAKAVDVSPQRCLLAAAGRRTKRWLHAAACV